MDPNQIRDHTLKTSSSPILIIALGLIRAFREGGFMTFMGWTGEILTAKNLLNLQWFVVFLLCNGFVSTFREPQNHG